MKKNNINIKIGGQAGKGIKVSGQMLGRSLTRLGFSTCSYREYPSLIRGGHNSYDIHAGIEPVYSHRRKIDILISLNKQTIDIHKKNLHPKSIVIYDPDQFQAPQLKKGILFPIQLIKLAEKAGGKKIMANIAGLSAVLTLLQLPIDTLEKVIEKKFADKPPKIIDLNKKTARLSRQFVKENLPAVELKLNIPDKQKPRMVLTGNEAFSLGALSAGLKFFSAYPMTPATSILHFLAKESRNFDLVVKHTEDEISAVNMALGASFAGTRAMTATSGGGLALMAEGISLAGISETPLVIVNSQRPGPGLGMPTWTAQADLKFTINIGHDEFPRIVLAPGDVEECFQLGRKAFQLAEKYQLPVFILIDKYLSETDFSTEPFKNNWKNKRHSLTTKTNRSSEAFFKRYRLTETGISKRSLPGQKGGIHCCNSYEHNQKGLGTEQAETRSLMMEKRLNKMTASLQEMPEIEIFGDKQAKTGIISWGSNKGVILQALKQLQKVKFLHLNWIWPFPQQQTDDFLSSCQKTFCFECNATGQLADLIKEQTGKKVEKILKYNGRPFYPDEIKKQLT